MRRNMGWDGREKDALESRLRGGFGVGKEGGRPEGTTAERGFGVGREGGRPEGTTAERGFGVGREGCRPESTSERAGFKVEGQARPSVCLHIMCISGCVKHFPQPGAKIHFMPSKYLRVRLHNVMKCNV